MDNDRISALMMGGASKLLATPLHALRARGKRWGLQTMCEGDSIANATIIETF